MWFSNRSQLLQWFFSCDEGREHVADTKQEALVTVGAIWDGLKVHRLPLVLGACFRAPALLILSPPPKAMSSVASFFPPHFEILKLSASDIIKQTGFPSLEPVWSPIFINGFPFFCSS